MYIFIVNPTAGNGHGKRVFKTIQKSSLYKEIESKHYFTKYPGHAEQLAKQITSKLANLEAIIVIGGDGTIHEVMNSVADSPVKIAFIPGGSGNDFARGNNMKGTPLQILDAIIHGKSTDYWLGTYQVEHQKQRLFANSIGFGFDAEIAVQANKSIYKKILNRLRIGTFSYVIALIHVLFRFKPFQLELTIDGKKIHLNNCWMVTVTNHPYYGGGMKINPYATVQERLISVLTISNISKWKVFGFFLTVFTGRHTRFKEVHLYEAEQIQVNSDREIYYQVDGQTDKCQQAIISKQREQVSILGSKQV